MFFVYNILNSQPENKKSLEMFTTDLPIKNNDYLNSMSKENEILFDNLFHKIL